MSAHILSDDELATWQAVKRLSGQALAAVSRDIEAATGLSGADFGILTRLEDLGEGQLAQATLLASLEWEKSRLSHHLTRMEVRHLIERDRSNTRSVMVRILPSGHERIALARPVHAVAVRRHILQHTTLEDARVLTRIVERLSKAAEV